MRAPLLTALITAALAVGAGAEDDADLAKRIDASIRNGVDFLVKDQNTNGSWGSATRTKRVNIYAPIPGAHHAFRAGATGLALSGLLEANDPRPEVAATVDKAADWTARTLPDLRRADQHTMYNIWGHAYGLRSITRLHQRATDPEDKAKWVALAAGQIELSNRYADINGGWGYYDIRDGLTTKIPSGMPTSFTTATLLLALAEARDEMSLELNDKVTQRAIASINSQRAPDFSYAYGAYLKMRPRLAINRPAGSLSRSQACNAALRVFGEEAITEAVLVDWADRFLARIGFIDNGRKRPIPHEAPFQIAGYFYYYGVYYFTRSCDLLPLAQQQAYARQLAPILIAKQEQDGSWWDFPLYDYHQPYGTGYALMALSWCRDVIDATPTNTTQPDA